MPPQLSTLDTEYVLLFEVYDGYKEIKFIFSCVSSQLTISFNESSLQSTYEYPSESSVWDSGEEDEDDKQDGTPADEQPSMVGRFHIPRPSLVGSPVHSENGNGETRRQSETKLTEQFRPSQSPDLLSAARFENRCSQTCSVHSD